MTGIRIWPSAALAHRHADRTTTVRKATNHAWLTVPHGLERSADLLITNLDIQAGAT